MRFGRGRFAGAPRRTEAYGSVTQKSAFLDRQVCLSPRTPLVAAAIAAANLWLFLEASHRFGIRPTGASQIIVVLISILFQATPHMTGCLMLTKSSAAH